MTDEPTAGHQAEAAEARKRLMALLAGAPGELIATLWREAGVAVEGHDVRKPETGLVTVKGRVGGGGAPFNTGEATVTRAAVRLSTGEIGHAYALGRDHAKARLSATIDAAWQRSDLRAAVEERVLAGIETALAEADQRRRNETAATKVDFFTMVRGED